MKKYFVKKCCITFVLALCFSVGSFAQQKVNSENARNNQSRANVEFTDMSFLKGIEVNPTKASVTGIAEKSVAGVRGTGTFNIATGIGTGNGWTWNSPILTILDASDVTVTGHADQTDNHNKIVIAANATTHLTLSDVYLIMEKHEGEPYEHPIFLEQGATLTLTITGENIVAAGHYVPGISVSAGRTIIIEGTGSLSATGGWQCSGIGGGLWDWGPCGTIIINGGTIYAKGDNSSWGGTAGAGIGSGAAYSVGDITINGGSIIAVPGNETGKGIGNGAVGESGNLTITGNPIIFATSVGDMRPDNKTGGILVARNATHWYGNNNYTLEYNTTVPNTNLLTVAEGKSITIPAGITMINNGTIVNYSTITINGTLINNGSILNVNSGTVTGTVTGNAPTPCTPADNTINLSSGSPSQVGTGWVFANNVYAVLDGADVTITGTSSKRVEVAANAMADITLNNASITGVSNYITPLMINTGSKVNMTIEGNNTITSTRSKAGVQVPEGAALTIDGTGSLTATGGLWGGAGIGGASCENCGSITINGGIITATSVESGSYHDGAGIGGGGAGIVFFFFEGMGGYGGDVTINGGVVKANTAPSSGAAGIGGGSKARYGGTLTMEHDGVAFPLSLVTYEGVQTDISGVTNGILFDGLDGLLYGTVTITDDIEIPELYTLIIPNEKILIIPKGRTLTIKGAVVNNGIIINCGTIIGTIENNQPLPCDPTEMYKLTFNVFDAETQIPVPNAVITFNGTELDGYEVEVEEGSYEYSVAHPDYNTYSGTQYVNASMTINIPLLRKVGIADITINDVALYPNPFMNEIIVSNPSIVKSVTITDITGQNVKTVTFDGKTISTKELASGIYFIILESHNGEKVFNKMIKK
ncbi:MAG: T9SS type A sorting domain-containing protein [Bacteroidetes bacterium]|nr:T9SS type A sorting domain-containing protein [Bacteroidota bacterium]MCL1968158.1 T9SS type A sorting domain-containing protein [Bacteroidota bacterium]